MKDKMALRLSGLQSGVSGNEDNEDSSEEEKVEE